MGLLGEIFGYGNTLKRRLNGLLSDPAGTIDLGARRFNEDQNKLIELMRTAYPMAGDKSVLQDQQQQAQARNSLADAALNTYGGLLGATVWHGSPHKFDKFDSSKIGTGEGAQAYGHGLYLAESPDVARSYQTALAADRGFSFGGKSGLTRTEVQDMVNAKYGAEYLDGVTRPSGVADSFIDDMVTGLNRADGSYPRQFKPGSQRARVYDELRGQITHADPGSLYKVDLPDNAIARMLDWDAALSNQPLFVRDAIKSAGVADGGGFSGSLSGRELYKRARNGAPAKLPLRQIDDEIFAAQRLRAAGIPGIRYLDGGSRGAGQGTSNYVVFPGEEGLLTILERNGVPLP